MPTAIRELIDVNPTVLILPHGQEVERIWTGRTVAALANAIEVVDSDGKDSITVEQGARDLEAAPRTLPSMFTSQNASRAGTADVLADGPPKIVFVDALLALP